MGKQKEISLKTSLILSLHEAITGKSDGVDITQLFHLTKIVIVIAKN